MHVATYSHTHNACRQLLQMECYNKNHQRWPHANSKCSSQITEEKAHEAQADLEETKTRGGKGAAAVHRNGVYLQQQGYIYDLC